MKVIRLFGFVFLLLVFTAGLASAASNSIDGPTKKKKKTDSINLLQNDKDNKSKKNASTQLNGRDTIVKDSTSKHQSSKSELDLLIYFFLPEATRKESHL